tara:strand:- start:130 stop:744 length:615 start_codon:yes stop_codon:yes gene_type:complete
MTAKIKLNAASGGGSVSFQAPSSSSNTRVITLPDTADGTVLTTTNPKAGNIIQVGSTTKTDTASASVAQGAVSSALISLSFTATSSSNTLIIIANVNLGFETAANIYATLLIGGSASAFRGDAASNRQRVSSASPEAGSASNITNFNIVYRLSSPSTSSTVYGVAGSHAQDATKTVYLNRTHGDGDNNYIARTASSITIMEVAA